MEADVLILGAGLTGLAAGSELGEHAVVLEKAAAPGGVARSVCFDGYWFDFGAHVLYFRDAALLDRVQQLMDGVLARCSLDGRVQTEIGTTRYPFQWHIADLDPEAAVACLRDLAQVTFGPAQQERNFEELLQARFGRTMCEAFLLPYNRKLWQRPLSSLSPTGITWAIASPDFETVLRGALSRTAEARPYNAESWYPRPDRRATPRGIGLLAKVLSERVPGLRLEREVTEIDLDARTVRAVANGVTETYRYGYSCVSTIPLPQLVRRCVQMPRELREACARLPYNRVRVAAFAVRGLRPEREQFRYFASPAVPFTRVSYMHAFDPDCAPPEGWCVLAEVPESCDVPPAPSNDLLTRCEASLRRTGAIPADCQVVSGHVLTVDPAYVVFTPEAEAVVAETKAALEQWNVVPLGRYGTWTYASMCDALADGFTYGESARTVLSGARTAASRQEWSRV